MNNKKLLQVFISIFLSAGISAQVKDILSLVDPFIGTTKSSSFTKWGAEGGTYPGAVAPSGYVQLSPETSVAGTRGYDYADSVIYNFSCLHHSSGFPNGSSGRLLLMPVAGNDNFNPASYCRPFLHVNEKAIPGYYRVVFSDNKTMVEATASERAGILRCTFPRGVLPKILIRDAGEITFVSGKIIQGTAHNAVIHCSQPYTAHEALKGGALLSFESSGSAATVIELAISASPVGTASALRNIEAAIAGGFDGMLHDTQEKWLQHLSVVEISDNNLQNKQKFYTALYHALLIPWIISDADGNYRGTDGRVHKVGGHNEYGNFSPWDTYRTLHPMLSLLYPGKQADILLSIMDIYYQSGYLPTESMTGNHAIPIITDAWLKGIHGIDPDAAYTAMKKSLFTGPFIQSDMEVFNALGYVPFTYPESVTRTVEYAYDDWVLAQFSRDVMKTKKEYDLFLQQSFNYRNLFSRDSMFLLPRNKNEFKLRPGTIGYKEGDKWAYSYAVPQNGKDLVNLMGGKEEFSNRLDAALTNGQVVFDNETVFHVPYLFNIAGHPLLTQKWIRKIIDTRFSATPGGLPGNDDLGSTSSWLVLSALGIYPLCPGKPVYTIGSPLFKSVTLHLANKKTFLIKSINAASGNCYIRSLLVNNQPQKQLYIPHSLIIQGGQMVFDMTAKPNGKWFDKKQNAIFSETDRSPVFKVLNDRIATFNVEPNEKIWIKFSVKNEGAKGTKVVKLFIGKKEYASKNCVVDTHELITDSIALRLYAEGKVNAFIDGALVARLNVIRPSHPYPLQPAITNLAVQPVVKSGDSLHIYFSAQNIGGVKGKFYIPVLLNDQLTEIDTIQLMPGETGLITLAKKLNGAGRQMIRINDQAQPFKVYNTNKDALLLDLKLTGVKKENNQVHDNSGFNNDANIINAGKSLVLRDSLLLDENCFVEVPNSYSLDHMDSVITMMTWIYPAKKNNGLVDVFSKGDNHVLQIVNDKQLSFFAGGWGRGDCTVDLPANWQNNWHHIAGVCDGRNLHIYIDGQLKGSTALTEAVNLSVSNKWTIGRNEEFPSQRIFTGYMDKIKVFAAPLTAEEINAAMMQ